MTSLNSSPTAFGNAVRCGNCVSVFSRATTNLNDGSDSTKTLEERARRHWPQLELEQVANLLETREDFVEGWIAGS
jgi:hypothetical protein